LENSAFLHRDANDRGYGTVTTRLEDAEDDTASTTRATEEAKAREEEEARKKTWLLNEETRMFLKDHTMWWLTAGIFLVTGPGEAFLNNLGTIIGTLYPPSTDLAVIPTTAATHISVVAISSTITRIVSGTVTDWLAPTAAAHHYRTNISDSVSSLPPQRRFAVSRVAFLITFAIIMSAGQVLLASGLIQGHGERFWIVTTLMGSGFGAIFSLTPIIISVIWGVENFGTNWGIVATVPALGATFWGIVYSTVYERATNISSHGREKIAEDVLCYGKECYSSTFWAMAVSVWIACVLWLWAWKGTNGWSKRGIAV